MGKFIAVLALVLGLLGLSAVAQNDLVASATTDTQSITDVEQHPYSVPSGALWQLPEQPAQSFRMAQVDRDIPLTDCRDVCVEYRNVCTTICDQEGDDVVCTERCEDVCVRTEEVCS